MVADATLPGSTLPAATPPAHDPELDDHPILEGHEVRAALAAGQLEVHYQPVVVLPLRQVVGFEALARLRRPGGQLLPPAAFVPVAERDGLIVSLGEVVLRRAIADLARWSRSNSLIATATVSVNVAPAQLSRPAFADLVLELLDAEGVPGSALILEITESTATSAQVRPVLERLSAAGVRIALDDFGVGFATLDNLRRLPVHVLKLDASFVAGVTREGADRAIVRVVIDLANRLGLSVIAEGVETEEQAQSLTRLGCPAGQGHLFAGSDRDPEVAAGRVAPSGTEHLDVDDGPPLWSEQVDAVLLGAARVLARGADRHRAMVHALAADLARVTRAPLTSVRRIGRLALVHDMPRLAVDGRLPAVLRDEPVLAGLLEPAGLGAPGEELAVVRLAVELADAAVRVDPQPGRQALGAALMHRAVAEADRGDARLADILATMATDPPDVPELDDVLGDLDRRRAGRHGTADRLRALVGITRVLASSGDPIELLTAGLEETRRIVGAASATLERWERDSGVLRALVNVGQRGPGEERLPADETYPLTEYAQARRTLLTGLPYIHTVDDADADVEAVELLRGLQKYSSAAVPLYLEGRLWGQLWLATQVGDPPFQASDVELLTAIATLMSVVVAQADSLDRISRRAFEDPLTRVGNRRAVDDVLAQLAAMDADTAVILIDVDLLKEINDSLGHASGDQALIRVADALSQVLARLPGGSVGRLGGDEFCVVAPGCSGPQARLWTAEVQRLLAVEDGRPAISVGVAVSTPGWQPRDLLAAADADLYAAKCRASARLRPGRP
jgi:diguanylate cyclase (GGDEF)-like protein